MGWVFGILVLSSVQYLSVTKAMTFLPANFDDSSQQNIDDQNAINVHEDVKLEQLGRILADILVQPWPKGISPILYVEEFPSQEQTTPDEIEKPYKRSRYYRKYPWKRQNSRYDAEKYLCQPTKEDVFRLLVALHEARQGSRGQMVNFCNRKRPASAIFTNIRFLG